MVLVLPADADPADARRLAKLVLYSACIGHHHASQRPQTRQCRTSYRDD